MASASDEEDPVAPSSSNLFCKDAFVVIKPGYQPSRLPEAPLFLGKGKNNVKACVRKLTVSIYVQDQLLPFNFVDAQLQCQIDIKGILCKAENVRIEDDVVALDEDEYSSCVIDCLVYGDQTTARECQKRQEHLMKSFKCNPQRQQCEPSVWHKFCATGLHRTHELTKCSGRQLTNKRTKWERTLVSGDM